jgi:hypothetical protein
MNRPASGKLVRGMQGQPHLFLRAEQNDVGQGRLDRIPDPACPIRAVQEAPGRSKLNEV